MVEGLCFKYDGCGLNFFEDEIKVNFEVGKFYVICMKILSEGMFKFNDYLCGDIEILWENVDM